MTLYRFDLGGFSRLSEELAPYEMVQVMAEYLTAMTDTVMEHQGFIDKNIGDAIDGVFGAPADDPEHAVHAVKAAMGARKTGRADFRRRGGAQRTRAPPAPGWEPIHALESK